MTKKTPLPQGTKERDFLVSLWDTARFVLLAVFFAFLLRSFLYAPFHIPSGSMLPTLHVGDYLFVSKYSYGYSRFSFPFSLPLFAGRIFDKTPRRGDVVVFRLPTDDRIDYIKRVVGLPGDVVELRSGRLWLNGTQVPRRLHKELPQNAGREYLEEFDSIHEHRIWEQNDTALLDHVGPFYVPEGHIFVLGDNRDSSSDSRVLFRVGFIPMENLVGRAQMIFFSVRPEFSFWQFWNWPEAIRFSRLGTLVR